ncbi:hypothetical protein EG327_008026 [Venturia inaequalis]|uniref:Uncharacterized protein n=1 Tax=Venturia inaequalis TaxID=5025 RepID=A0A8H3USQ4_VENIN|nr:hypothetical protein EG327_008026 [Venturia inaequalis]
MFSYQGQQTMKQIFIAKSCESIRHVLSVSIKKTKHNARNAYVASGENGRTARASDNDEMAKLLFGTEDNIKDAGERLRKIGELEFDQRKDMVDDMVKGPPGDIWIYCDLRRFDTEKNGFVWDTRNGHKLTKALYDRANANGKVRLLAFTANFVDGKGNKLSVTSVNFVTWYMNFIQNRRYENKAVVADGSPFAKKMVRAVAHMPISHWIEVDEKNAALGIMLPPATPIDAFRFLVDSVLLHEFGHSHAAGLGDDTDGDKSYGWWNVVRIKKPNNCDSLLMFAISITIQDVDHGGYRAKKDGWLFLPLAESAANV